MKVTVGIELLKTINKAERKKTNQYTTNSRRLIKEVTIIYGKKSIDNWWKIKKRNSTALDEHWGSMLLHLANSGGNGGGNISFSVEENLIHFKYWRWEIHCSSVGKQHNQKDNKENIWKFLIGTTEQCNQIMRHFPQDKFAVEDPISSGTQSSFWTGGSSSAFDQNFLFS